MRGNKLFPHLSKLALAVLLTISFLKSPAGQPLSVQADAGSSAPAEAIFSPGPPFADTNIGNYPGLALGDIDADGRIDALAADQFGQISYFHNGGGPNLGAVFFRDPISDPKYPGGLNIYVGNPQHNSKTIPRPDLVDYNGDGKLDLFVAAWNSNESYGEVEKPVILYFERQADGSFLQNTSNPLSRIPGMLNLTSKFLTISVGDLNYDGLPDAVLGYFSLTDATSGYYHIGVFINNGSSTDPIPLYDSTFPENAQSLTQKGSPRLADVNGDGRLDLFVGYGDGTTAYYENIGSGNAPLFIQKTGPENPLNPSDSSPDLVGPDVGRDAIPCLGKLDGDADLDALIASTDGRVTYFRNDGTLIQPAFSKINDVKDPFRGLDGGLKNWIQSPGGSAITFGDLNADGIPDALVGGVSKGQLRNFQGVKDGPSSSDFHFRELPQEEKWFISPSLYFAQPLLVDLDKNGSLDLLIAAQSPAPATTFTISYYRNNANPQATPDFVLQTGPDDPFSTLSGTGFIFPNYPIAAVGDIDKDGFQEMLIGGSDGKIVYLRYNGSQFIQPSPSENPFKDANIPYAAPFLGDADGDGSLDLLVGEGRLFIDSDPNKTAGTIHYFQHRKASQPASNPLYSELTGFNNPFYWFSTREFTTPVLADLNGDQINDLVSGSGFGTFYFYPNVGTQTEPAYRDYIFNPLAQVVSPNPDQVYPISVSLVDLNGDKIQDAFVGTPSLDGPSKLLFYKNIGSLRTPVFRRMPDEQNPLSAAQSQTSLINVSFGDTDSNGSLEAYVGGDNGGITFVKYYQWVGTTLLENSETQAAQFPKNLSLINGLSSSDLAPRLQFARRSGSSLLDATIYLGQVSGAKHVFYATNSGTTTNPIYTYASLNDWINGPNNPYFKIGTVEAGFNTAWANPQTLWAGNSAGELYTLKNTFFDPATKRSYIDRVAPENDLLSQAHLPGPSVLSSADVNGDGLNDGFIAASDGTIHYIRSSSLRVYLPYTRR